MIYPILLAKYTFHISICRKKPCYFNLWIAIEQLGRMLVFVFYLNHSQSRPPSMICLIESEFDYLIVYVVSSKSACPQKCLINLNDNHKVGMRIMTLCRPEERLERQLESKQMFDSNKICHILPGVRLASPWLAHCLSSLISSLHVLTFIYIEPIRASLLDMLGARVFTGWKSRFRGDVDVGDAQRWLFGFQFFTCFSWNHPNRTFD